MLLKRGGKRIMGKNRKERVGTGRIVGGWHLRRLREGEGGIESIKKRVKWK
jgi:hypothetical protein